MTNISATIYHEIASLHVGHSLKNRPYDNWLFSKIIDNIGDLKSKNILEFGCGYGHYANFLLQNGGENIYGVDIDFKAIEYANANSNGGKFFHLSKDGVERVVDLGTQFDEVYSMYVYETINDKDIIEKIFSDIYQIIKEGGKLQFIIGNLKEFYGKKCCNEFEFLLDPNFPILKECDPYIARLATENGFFDVRDFYYSNNTIATMLYNAGFKNVSIQRHKLNGDEYDGMIDEKDFIPSLIFVAQK